MSSKKRAREEGEEEQPAARRASISRNTAETQVCDADGPSALTIVVCRRSVWKSISMVRGCLPSKQVGLHCAPQQRSADRVDLTPRAAGHRPIAWPTGIGFLDHMLTALAKHGRFDLTLKCKVSTLCCRLDRFGALIPAIQPRLHGRATYT